MYVTNHSPAGSLARFTKTRLDTRSSVSMPRTQSSGSDSRLHTELGHLRLHPDELFVDGVLKTRRSIITRYQVPRSRGERLRGRAAYASQGHARRDQQAARDEPDAGTEAPRRGSGGYLRGQRPGDAVQAYEPRASSLTGAPSSTSPRPRNGPGRSIPHQNFAFRQGTSPR